MKKTRCSRPGRVFLSFIACCLISVTLTGCSAGQVFQKAIDAIRDTLPTVERAYQEFTGKPLDWKILDQIRTGLDKAEQVVPEIQRIQDAAEDPGAVLSPFGK